MQLRRIAKVSLSRMGTHKIAKQRISGLSIARQVRTNVRPYDTIILKFLPQSSAKFIVVHVRLGFTFSPPPGHFVWVC